MSANNRRKAFEVMTSNGRTLPYPYAKLDVAPTAEDPIADVFVDDELARDAFTYRLASGRGESVHIEQVLEYNRDPTYLREATIYELTLEVRRRVDHSALSKREIIRRLGTSATQFYRLLDTTNYRKSIGQLIAVLEILDCEVEVVVRDRH